METVFPQMSETAPPGLQWLVSTNKCVAKGGIARESLESTEYRAGEVK